MASKKKFTAPRVSQLSSPRTGNPVANQFEIRTSEGVWFQSYDTLIAFREYGTGQVYLNGDMWDYSNTTNKYRGQWLGENTAETRKKLANGTYKTLDM